MTDVLEPTTEAGQVRREVTVDAPIEDVWETVSTDAGRARWLEPDDDRTLVIDDAVAPSQISWWWWQESDAEPARHVEIRLVPTPDRGATHVTVTETLPSLVPVARLAAACATAPMACCA